MNEATFMKQISQVMETGTCCHQCHWTRLRVITAIADDGKDDAAAALQDVTPKLRQALAELPLTCDWRNLGMACSYAERDL